MQARLLSPIGAKLSRSEWTLSSRGKTYVPICASRISLAATTRRSSRRKSTERTRIDTATLTSSPIRKSRRRIRTWATSSSTLSTRFSSSISMRSIKTRTGSCTTQIRRSVFTTAETRKRRATTATNSTRIYKTSLERLSKSMASRRLLITL